MYIEKAEGWKNEYSWNYDNKVIDIVKKCLLSILGITLNSYGSFHKTKSVLASQSKKTALFIVRNKAIAFERNYYKNCHCLRHTLVVY